MSERTLLASVALFSELYNSDKDVYDVIGEFIKAAMILESIWIFDATHARQMLLDVFELDIPQAVVRTTLQRRLVKKQNALRYENGYFHLEDQNLKNDRKLVNNLSQLTSKQNQIVERLKKYITEKHGELKGDDEENIISCFLGFLSGNSRNSKFLPYMSSFIIENEKDGDFISALDETREGLVLYDGVRHTPNLNTLGVWREPLAIFLDPEHLFNAVGFNGTLYKELFKDFLSLANDVRNQGKKQISLWYFNDCQDEINKFFYVAELILQGKASPLPGKPAMLEIINGCQSPADVVAKKSDFFSALDKIGIRNGEHLVGEANFEFNIEGTEVLQKVKFDIEASDISYDEEKCLAVLRAFSKINQLRKGRSQTSFENSRAIVLTGSAQTRFIAFHPAVQDLKGSIPYATDLDFLTNRLWFRLGKGLSKQLSPPKSLSVLAKAQVVLASQINDNVNIKYQEVKKNFDSGKLTKENAEYLVNELRSRAIKPEEIDNEDISNLIIFLDEKGYEAHIRERQHLHQKAKQGELAIKELADIRKKIFHERLQRKGNIYRRIFYLGFLVLAGAIAFTYYIGIKLILSVAESQDTTLGIASIILSLIMGTAPLIKYKAICTKAKQIHFSALRKAYSDLKTKRDIDIGAES